MSSTCGGGAARTPDGGAAKTCLRDSCFVLIPALNEEETIVRVVADLRSHGFQRIRVIDNGSSDATVLRTHSSGAEVIREPRRGYGRACWTALQDTPDDIEWILFCDADGSSDLRDLDRLVTAAPSVDLVLGDRTAISANRATMTFAQKFGNALATTLIRWGWGYRYSDLGPLRLIRVEALKQIAMRDRGFGWTVEMQVRAIELGLRITEIPVRYRVRQGGRSKISGTIIGTLRAGTVIVFTIGKLLVTRRANVVVSDFKHSST